MQIFRHTINYHGRERNCYRIAREKMEHAWKTSTRHRQVRKLEMNELWNFRLEAAANEHQMTNQLLHDHLHRQNIRLNKKSLSDLAIFEPKTFAAICQIAKQHGRNYGYCNGEADEKIIIGKDNFVDVFE
ncbi:hypothetical protein SNEBB_004929 [Seison nebaliae]|nr:hypothetical protein SNEBB_004929 [Seison nebaliae]